MNYTVLNGYANRQNLKRDMDNLSIEYNQDFYSWLCHNVSLLRSGRLSEIYVENIAEELEGMSKSQHREFVNRLKILFIHLLKWQFQPDRRSSSWKGTIIEQRSQIIVHTLLSRLWRKPIRLPAKLGITP